MSKRVRQDEGEAAEDESRAGTRDDKAGRDDEDLPAPGVILVAFEKLFAGGRGVRRFRNSGLRHVELPEGATLIEQNPKKSSEWAELAREGRRVAWVMRDGEYLARVIDGEVTFLK